MKGLLVSLVIIICALLVIMAILKNSLLYFVIFIIVAGIGYLLYEYLKAMAMTPEERSADLANLEKELAEASLNLKTLANMAMRTGMR